MKKIKDGTVGSSRVKNSLRKKLLSTSGIALFIVAAVIAVVVFIYVKNLLTVISKDNLTNVGMEYTNDIEAWVNVYRGNLDMVERNFEYMDNTDEEIIAELTNYQTLDGLFSGGIYLADENDNFYDIFYTPDASYKATERDWYIEGVNNDTMVSGEPYIDTATGDYCVTYSALVNSSDDQLVVAADLMLTDVAEKVKDFAAFKEGKSILVYLGEDSTTVLASSDAEDIGKKLTEYDDSAVLSQVDTLARTANGEVDSISVGGESYFVVADAVGDLDWVLVTYVPESIILEQVNTLGFIMIIAAFASALVVGIIIVFVINRIISPMRKLTENIEVLTSGDFTVEVESSGHDEIGLISDYIRKFASGMREMARNSNTMSKNLAEQADRSSEVSNALYTSAADQDKSMKELNDTVEEMVASVTEVATDATNLATIVSEVGDKGVVVNNQMKQTVDASTIGKRDMKELIVTMASIEEAMSKLQEVVEQVGGSTAEINKFVDIIGSISSQTNLLSLNAAIEAARAGEAGKGFAVVAAEIRELADNSQKAAAQISTITNEISSLVGTTVQKTREGVALIKESDHRANTVNDAYTIILDNIKNSSEMIGEMIEQIREVDEVATSLAAITEEQSAGTEEILATSENLSQLAQNVTDNSEAVARDAEEIENTAKSLAQQMSRYKY